MYRYLKVCLIKITVFLQLSNTTYVTIIVTQEQYPMCKYYANLNLLSPHNDCWTSQMIFVMLVNDIVFYFFTHFDAGHNILSPKLLLSIRLLLFFFFFYMPNQVQ